MSVVKVTDLRVETPEPGIDIVDDINFTIDAGELLGVVGESGSGKTTVACALLGFARRGARITGGSVVVDGVDVLAITPRELRALRGRLIAYVPQEPAVALNPAIRVKDQLIETLKAHDLYRGNEVERAREVLARVGLPSTDEMLRRYPHELSGGQQQRVAIAMAFICDPKVLVMDEPTTGLDVTTQAALLRTVQDLCASSRTAGLYVTHDLAVVSGLVSRVLVLYAGRIAEVGLRDDVFSRPSHPYTRMLLQSAPDIAERRVLKPIKGQAPAPGERPTGCPFFPRCPMAIAECSLTPPPLAPVAFTHSAACIRTRPREPWSPALLPAPETSSADAPPLLEARGLHVSHGDRRVVDDVSVSLAPGECVALVGESGSGKTTLARSLMGLKVPDAGEVAFHGQVVAPAVRARPATVRKGLQYIFQNPYSALNPRKTIRASLEVPVRQFFGRDQADTERAIQTALERVALSPSVGARYPGDLSGGERQRVAIARALICEPEVIICDEITSALDVSVQAAIVELLDDLRMERQLSILFVTHNLALVRTIARRVFVMKDGRVVESGSVGNVLDEPGDPYTRKLLADTPTLSLATTA